MGAFYSFPVKAEPVLYVDPAKSTSAGRDLEPSEYESSEYAQYNPLTETTAQLFESAIEQRKAAYDARDKFRSFTFETVSEKFPMWTEENISELKAQFLTFDTNQDGLIGFHELSSVLDEMGETTSPTERLAYFSQFEVNYSGSVDFEDYVNIIGGQMAEKDTSLWRRWAHLSSIHSRRRELTPLQQLAIGIF